MQNLFKNWFGDKTELVDAAEIVVEAKSTDVAR